MSDEKKYYQSKRSFSFGFPGKDVEFARNAVYDKLPDGIDETDFNVVGKGAFDEYQRVAKAKEPAKKKEPAKPK